MPTSYIYSDIDLELTKQSDSDITRDTGFDAVENSITNIMSTLQGNRRMLPAFADNTYQTLFEPMDEFTSYRIGTTILAAIELWDDRILIEGVNVNADYENNQYIVSITYGLKNVATELKTVDYILIRE